jgi:hypothetical protein
MGSKRRAEDTDSGRRVGPKLTVTGRLEGTFASRPVELVAEGRELSLRVRNLRSAWAMRRSISAATEPVMRTLGASGIRVRFSIGRRWKIAVLPKPNLVLRALFPGLRTSTA